MTTFYSPGAVLSTLRGLTHISLTTAFEGDDSTMLIGWMRKLGHRELKKLAQS